MTIPQIERDRSAAALSDAQKSTGRQDLISPDATIEKSDTPSVDRRRGKRMWLGFALLAIAFAAIIIYTSMS